MISAGEAVMMGRRVMAEPLFHNFRLEDHVPTDHVLRAVDQLLDTGFVRKVMTPYYATMDRPSIDPELMIRVLLIGYLNGIRSERRLCAEVHLNLAYRWFCRLGLDGPVPEQQADYGHHPQLKVRCRDKIGGCRERHERETWKAQREARHTSLCCLPVDKVPNTLFSGAPGVPVIVGELETGFLWIPLRVTEH